MIYHQPLYLSYVVFLYIITDIGTSESTRKFPGLFYIIIHSNLIQINGYLLLRTVIPPTNCPSLYDHLLDIPVISTKQKAF